MLNHDEEPRSGGIGKVLAIGLGVVAVMAAVYVGVTQWTKPAPAPAESQPARSEPARPAPKPAAPAVKAETPAPAPRTRVRTDKPVEAPKPAASEGPVLVVESDVAGASVFVDRKYVGTTPLRTTDVTAGTHQVNASATGEDGVVQTVDVSASGETAVTLKFREVRLDARLDAVHKHTLGSCKGILSATPDGIRYETDNKKDGFFFPLRDLEVFTIDYLKKELRIKQRGGKTWNFTDKTENADKLFIFHRDVSKAKDKLAALGR